MTLTLEPAAQHTLDVDADVWAVYLRRSEADDDAGVLRHRKRGARFCDDNGYVAEFYVDNDRPASEGSAPRLDYLRMLDGINSGRIRGVWVFEQSRLTRDNDESNAFMRIAKTHRVLVAVKERVYDLTRATDRHTFRADANDATMEVERMSERLAEMFDDVIDTEGRAWWPCRPFGFEMPTTDEDGERVAPTLNDDEAKLIVRAYEDVLNGRSMRSIAKEWNAAGVRTPTRRLKANKVRGANVPARTVGGNNWTGNAVRKILMNARNAGLRERLRTEKQNGKRVVVKREILSIKAEWPAIVSEELYYGVASILESQQRGPNAYVRKHLLSGLALCGASKTGVQCARPLTSGVQRARLSYVCKHCFGVTRSMPAVDAHVLEFVGDRLAMSDAHDLLRRDDLTKDVVADVRTNIKALEKKIVSRIEQNDAGDISDEQCRKSVATLRARIDELKASIEPARMRAVKKALESPDPRRYFLDAEIDVQRAIIAELGTFTIMPLPAGTSPRAPFSTRLIVPSGDLLGGVDAP